MFRFSIRFLATLSLVVLATGLVFALDSADAARFNRGHNERPLQPHHGQGGGQGRISMPEVRQYRHGDSQNVYRYRYRRQYLRNDFRSPLRRPINSRNEYQFRRPTPVHPGTRLQNPRPSYGIRVR